MSANRFAAPALAVAALAISIAVPGPQAADAKKRNCGPVVRKTAATTTNGERPPLTLGDSVMLLAVDDLAQAGFRVIAQGCRGFGWGLRTLRQVQANGSLPGLVVLSLGANHYAPGEEPRGVKDGELHLRDVRKALEILDDGSGTSASSAS